MKQDNKSQIKSITKKLNEALNLSAQIPEEKDKNNILNSVIEIIKSKKENKQKEIKDIFKQYKIDNVNSSKLIENLSTIASRNKKIYNKINKFEKQINKAKERPDLSRTNQSIDNVDFENNKKINNFVNDTEKYSNKDTKVTDSTSYFTRKPKKKLNIPNTGEIIPEVQKVIKSKRKINKNSTSFHKESNLESKINKTKNINNDFKEFKEDKEDTSKQNTKFTNKTRKLIPEKGNEIIKSVNEKNKTPEVKLQESSTIFTKNRRLYSAIKRKDDSKIEKVPIPINNFNDISFSEYQNIPSKKIIRIYDLLTKNSKNISNSK